MSTPIKFHPGSVFMTSGVVSLCIEIVPFLARHIRGDWGDQLGFDDILANERALVDGERLVSKYKVKPGVSIYIITEWDRSRTTILLPEEY